MSHETLTINVIQEDIDKGKPREPSMCPIALAIKREYHAPHVLVGGVIRKYDYEGSNTTYKTPHQILEWMTNFDMGLKVEPFSAVVEELVNPIWSPK